MYSPPPLKNHSFWWALIPGWTFISANTVCLYWFREMIHSRCIALIRCVCAVYRYTRQELKIYPRTARINFTVWLCTDERYMVLIKIDYSKRVRVKCQPSFLCMPRYSTDDQRLRRDETNIVKTLDQHINQVFLSAFFQTENASQSKSRGKQIPYHCKLQYLYHESRA